MALIACSISQGAALWIQGAKHVQQASGAADGRDGAENRDQGVLVDIADPVLVAADVLLFRDSQATGLADRIRADGDADDALFS